MEKEWYCLLVLYLLAANLAAFFLMGMDKRRARRGKRRVPERTLFLPAVLGGALGGTLGMHLFHHKTRHWYFRWGYPLLLLLQLAALGWLILGQLNLQHFPCKETKYAAEFGARPTVEDFIVAITVVGAGGAIEIGDIAALVPVRQALHPACHSDSPGVQELLNQLEGSQYEPSGH